jgi:aerobic carbon-monoxide dehydrogenase medium subunit
MMPEFDLARPRTLADALAAVADGATPYAGGTELVAAMKLGLLAPDKLVDLKRVPELSGVWVSNSSVVIGAATAHAVAERDATVRSRLPMLAGVLARIGNPRVRWQGTLGGNLCFAEPRSDLITALIALGATLTLRSVSEERHVPAAEFITDAFTTDRRDDELLISVSVDAAGIAFQRYERIKVMERPSVGVALVGRPDGWRLAIGAIGYVPLHHEAERLEDMDPDQLARSIEPIVDSSGSAAYKLHLVKVLANRLLAAAGEASGGVGDG